jgi:hypothetical protein
VNTLKTTLRVSGMAALLALTATGPALAQDDGAREAPAEPVEAAPAEAPAAPAEGTAAPEAAPETAPATPAEAPTAEPVGPTVSIPAAPAAPAESAEAPVAEEAAPAPVEAATVEPATVEPAIEPATGAPPRITVALPPPPSLADDLPIPTLTIDRIPPSTSFEFAIQVSYGTVAYFRDQVPPWVGFGLRGGWGKNFGLHRLGVAGILSAEGDIGVHTQLSLEPMLAWDYVSRGGVLLGAGVGPAGVYTSRNSTVETEIGFEVAPAAAARIGWSQTWSRVGRRLFLFVEPKVRMAEGRMSPVVAVAVGSGGGR